MAYLTIEVVRTEDLLRLNTEQTLIQLAKIGSIPLGQKARLAGLRVSDEDLSMNTGIVSFGGDGRAMAYGLYACNLIQDFFDSPEAFCHLVARRRINGVNYTMATEEIAIVFKTLILCELLQAVI